MKYKFCVDRFKIEENLKIQRKGGSIENMQAPIMVLDQDNQIIDNCFEVELRGNNRIIYSPQEILKVPQFQITLWMESEGYKKIK